MLVDEGGDILVGADDTSKTDFFSIYVEESIYNVSIHFGIKYMFSLSASLIVDIETTSDFMG